MLQPLLVSPKRNAALGLCRCKKQTEEGGRLGGREGWSWLVHLVLTKKVAGFGWTQSPSRLKVLVFVWWVCGVSYHWGWVVCSCRCRKRKETWRQRQGHHLNRMFEVFSYQPFLLLMYIKARTARRKAAEMANGTAPVDERWKSGVQRGK